jgi:hypothetical protein
MGNGCAGFRLGVGGGPFALRGGEEVTDVASKALMSDLIAGAGIGARRCGGCNLPAGIVRKYLTASETSSEQRPVNTAACRCVGRRERKVSEEPQRRVTATSAYGVLLVRSPWNNKCGHPVHTLLNTETLSQFYSIGLDNGTMEGSIGER